MKKHLTALGIALLLAGVASHVHGAGDNALMKMPIPNGAIKSMEYKNDLGLYEVVADNGNIFYVTKDNKYAIVGNVFELPAMRNVTEERKAQIFKVEFSTLPIGNAIRISEGSRKIAVFSSPDCPWCKRLHAELKLMKDVEVYVFLLPSGKSNAIWCSADRAEALDRAYSGGTFSVRK